MRSRIRVAVRMWAIALVCVVGIGCGGEVALNGLEPGEASDPGVTPDAGALSDASLSEATTETNPDTSSDDASGADGSGDESPTFDCSEVCGGCCTASGLCVGGQSIATCGVRGAACQDCAAEALACGPAGACVSASPDDASTPPTSCEPSHCPACVPVYSSPCCKLDFTCGCHLNFGGADAGSLCQ